MQPAFSPDELDQLQRAAQMFEMILDSGAPSDEAYETLKDVYDKLCKPDEYKRVTARFADFLLARDDRDAGLAQLVDLAERYPDEAEWRQRLEEFGAPLPVTDAASEPDKALEPEETPEAEEAPESGDAPSRDEVEAFNEAKQELEARAADVIRSADEEELDRAIGEAEQILCELDDGEAADTVVLDDDTPDELDEAVGSVDDEDAATADGQAAEPAGEAVDEAVDEPADEPVDEPADEPAAEPAAERASAQHIVARPHTQVSANIEKEIQKSLRLGEMLVEQGVITRDNLDEALEKQRSSSKRIGQILIDLGYATEEDVLNCLAMQAGVPYLPLALYEVQPEVAALLPADFVQRHRVLPVDQIANSVLVTIAAPLSPEVRAEIESLLGECKVNYYISEQSIIDQKIDELYPRPGAAQPQRGEA